MKQLTFFFGIHKFYIKVFYLNHKVFCNVIISEYFPKTICSIKFSYVFYTFLRIKSLAWKKFYGSLEKRFYQNIYNNCHWLNVLYLRNEMLTSGIYIKTFNVFSYDVFKRIIFFIKNASFYKNYQEAIFV